MVDYAHIKELKEKIRKVTDNPTIKGTILGLAVTGSMLGVASMDDGKVYKTTNEIVLNSEISKERAAELSLAFFEHTEKFMTDDKYNPEGFEELKFKDRSFYNNNRTKNPDDAARAVKGLMTDKKFITAEKMNLSEQECKFIENLSSNFEHEFAIPTKSLGKAEKREAGLARVREEISTIKRAKPISWEDAVMHNAIKDSKKNY